jgi:hypothetical protein
MPLRKLIPLVAASLALAACSTGAITGPDNATPSQPRFEDDGGGMLGGGGALIPAPNPHGGGILIPDPGCGQLDPSPGGGMLGGGGRK